MKTAFCYELYRNLPRSVVLIIKQCWVLYTRFNLPQELFGRLGKNLYIGPRFGIQFEFVKRE